MHDFSLSSPYKTLEWIVAAFDAECQKVPRSEGNSQDIKAETLVLNALAIFLCDASLCIPTMAQ
jgi:hypothetical protein